MQSLPENALVRPGMFVRTDETDMTLVTCSIERQQYGLPLTAVLQVVRLPALLTLVGAPRWICGLLNLRGHYLPVLSGRVLVDAEPHYDLTNQIIIVGNMHQHRSPSPRFGLLVDQVHDVQTFHRQRFTSFEQDAASAFLCGVMRAHDTSILVCSIDELLHFLPGEHTDSGPKLLV